MAATHLAFGTAPNPTPIPGEVWDTFTVEALDAGEAVDTGFTDDVTIALGDDGTGTLGGTLTVAAVAGVATFDDIDYDTVEQISIDVTAAGVTGIDEEPIYVGVLEVDWPAALEGLELALIGSAASPTSYSTTTGTQAVNREAARVAYAAGIIDYQPDTDYDPKVTHSGQEVSVRLLNTTPGEAWPS